MEKCRRAAGDYPANFFCRANERDDQQCFDHDAVMKATRTKVWYILKPWRLFLVVMGLIFAVEAAVMLLLPVLLPTNASTFHTAVFDACLLTGMLAPAMWWLIIRPLRSLIATRTELLARVLTAQEEERGRIARDLHDSLGQSLTCLTVGLRAVEERSTDADVRQHLQELRRVGADAHQEIRRLATGLRPSVLDDVGLSAALERHFDDIHKVQGLVTNLDLSGLSLERLPRDIETTLYRIVQEATSNAIRHGGATEIQLVVQRNAKTLELVLHDNGCGFDPIAAFRGCRESRSFGLCSMRERVDLLSGTLHVDSAIGAGTTVKVQIPVPHQSA